MCRLAETLALLLLLPCLCGLAVHGNGATEMWVSSEADSGPGSLRSLLLLLGSEARNTSLALPPVVLHLPVHGHIVLDSPLPLLSRSNCTLLGHGALLNASRLARQPAVATNLTQTLPSAACRAAALCLHLNSTATPLPGL